MRLSLNLDITETLQEKDSSVDTLKARQRSRRVSGALPSLTPVPSVISTPGRWHSTVGNTRSDHGCGHVCVGPRTANFINFLVLRTDAVNAVDWQQIGHLRRSGRDPPAQA